MLHRSIIIEREVPISQPLKPDISPDDRWRVPMKYLIRVAFAAITLAAIAPVANAATFHNGSTVAGDRLATQTQQQGAY
jgi:hypothetical protein